MEGEGNLYLDLFESDLYHTVVPLYGLLSTVQYNIRENDEMNCTNISCFFLF